MPIPAAPHGSPDLASVALALFRQLHNQVRDETVDLDDDALNWVPWEGANSIAVLVTHLVGSEAETLRCVAGVGCERDRGAEFLLGASPRAEVLARLERADGLLEELAPLITGERLRAQFSLPTLPPQRTSSWDDVAGWELRARP